MFLDRPLDPVEIRALGSLLEKQATTPESYPLSLNALVAACNQKTNREPVLELSEAEVRGALQRLQELQLVWEIHGGRVLRYDHRLDGRWGLTPPTRALLALLLLRGPQTPGELRSRGERLFRFETIESAEEELRYLSRGDEPLVRELPRRPGQKETRWTDLVGESATPEDDSSPPAPPALRAAESLTGRVEKLEREIARLGEQVAEIRKGLGLDTEPDR